MPPKSVRTVKQSLYWEIAKLLTQSDTGASHLGSTIKTFQKFDSAEDSLGNIVQENRDLNISSGDCVVCEAESNHTIPFSEKIPLPRVSVCEVCEPHWPRVRKSPNGKLWTKIQSAYLVAIYEKYLEANKLNDKLAPESEKIIQVVRVKKRAA